MILINTFGIQDSGGITVLDKVLKECSLDKSNNYLIACSNNKNINTLCNSYRDTSSFVFEVFEIKNLLHRFYIENVTFRILQNKHNIKLIYQFSGSAQLFSKTPQLIKLHNLAFFSKSVDKEFFVQKKYFKWLWESFIKRSVFSYMTSQCRFVEMQSRHVQAHIEDFVDISNKRLFFKSDIDTEQEDFNSPVVTDLKSKLTLIYIVGPHFEAVHKNFGTFVQAALKLKKDGVDFDIAITLTKEELNRSGLWDTSLDNRTRFLGYLPKRELMKVFEGNSVLISTSIIETLGLHVIEAVQNGVSAIVPNEKYSLSVYGPSVLTYQTFNADGLADSIKNRGSISYARLNDILEDSKAYLIRNEKSKFQSVVEVFDLILSEADSLVMTREKQICRFCVMDTTDKKIMFDQEGKCDHCQNFEMNIGPNWHNGKRGRDKLEALATKIKQKGRNKEFDCIIGISGGLDSSYTAYIAKEIMGLRPLLFHVDAGWNTDQAVANIEKLVNGLGIELFTEVINWKEMQDLQVAFLRSQIADQDIPQDTAFFSALYKFAKQNKVKYVLTGGNYSTECCREPDEWGAFPGIDKTLINAIHKKFGTRELKTFPIIDALVYKIYYHKILRMKVVKPLDMVPFIKADAEALLSEKYGWKAYQHKHHESRFTRFYEDYWMSKKFGYEKRRAHFSSLIMTSQMDRDEALERLKTPEMDDKFMDLEFEFVANKLGLSKSELQQLFDGENKSFHDYNNKYKIFSLGGKIQNLLGLERRHYR